jgi:hypothetical protein
MHQAVGSDVVLLLQMLLEIRRELVKSSPCVREVSIAATTRWGERVGAK